jgi:hypothetical protein
MVIDALLSHVAFNQTIHLSRAQARYKHYARKDPVSIAMTIYLCVCCFITVAGPLCIYICM